MLEDGTRIVAVLVRRNRIEKVHLFMNTQDEPEKNDRKNSDKADQKD